MARQLLRHRAVAADPVGKLLAQWLVDYLPFETELSDMLDSARLLLQADLIEEVTRTRLWEMGRRNKAYRIGFLLECPDNLPRKTAARADAQAIANQLTALADTGNRAAQLLIRMSQDEAQSFIAACLDILSGLNSQAEVSAALNAIGRYFVALRDSDEHAQTLQGTLIWAELTLAKQVSLDERYRDPAIYAQLRALYILAHASDAWVTPVFAHSDAGGSVMRKQIEPVITVISVALKSFV
ncbi:MAG: hypothetical protein HY273_00195 [Gammaproteobacteria bacterium]|nr:hypothetical protein [Gammaproteobacteria bacterium]